ncbi:MAG: threonine synthase [bacterium]|nr:threonine synthase [bacterium]
MKFVSTRGQAPELSFSQVVLEGLARDGGLYVPAEIPDFSKRLASLSALRYQDLALEIFTPFMAPDFEPAEIAHLVENSYASFKHSEITPLVKAGDQWVLELFHGPTLAFKDVALQFLGNLFEALLKRSGGELNIVGATSGDTGSAAIHGVRGKERVKIFILHPKGKVSPVQERQMTSVLDENVFNIAVNGNFDDAQNVVKELFNDHQFKDQYHLGAVNSINWARVMAQIVYYFYAYFRWQARTGEKEAVFAVPTGNFGDIFAGYLAQQMGLPIKKLLLATNENDVLSRAFNQGDYSSAQVKATLSPSMDIQLASNFERFLYYLADRQGAQVLDWMKALKEKGAILFDLDVIERANRSITAFRADERAVLEVMRRFEKAGMELDPHTAVGVCAAEQAGLKEVICLATAHPAKFSLAFNKATGRQPTIPEEIAQLEQAETRCLESTSDAAAIKALMIEKIGH